MEEWLAVWQLTSHALYYNLPQAFVPTYIKAVPEVKPFHLKAFYLFVLCVPQIFVPSEGTKLLLNNDVMSFMTLQCALFDFP